MFQFIRDSIRNPLEQIQSFSTVAEYKMNIQNKVVFLNITMTNTKEEVREKRERINLTKEAKVSYNEKFETVKKEIMENSKRQKHLPAMALDQEN